MKPKKVKIVEVGARDGLQNEDRIVKTQDKLKFIKFLSETGLTCIEATSFVSPKAIPQMFDAKEVVSGLNLDADIDYPCLVPNLKGLEAALSVGVKEISVFTATSDTFNKKNINATVEESFLRLQKVTQKAKQNNVKIRGYVSTAFGCPYDGVMSKEKLLDVTQKLFELGAYEVSIGDTIGIATPEQTDEYLKFILNYMDRHKIAMHMHDTYKRALQNIEVSLEHGISVFDSSTSGLGGCPYAEGATGNVATEDVLNLMTKHNIETGVDLAIIQKAGQFIRSIIGN
jgi:hydroxymethylglutaryl-CoA lyase